MIDTKAYVCHIIAHTWDVVKTPKSLKKLYSGAILDPNKLHCPGNLSSKHRSRIKNQRRTTLDNTEAI